MRLTCPNCGARYEVDDGMIPPEGRDVQCSNCTTTWFQPGSASAAAGDGEAAPPEPPEGDFDDMDEGDVPAADAPRRELDPESRDLLREEAEREAQLRRTESSELEHQDEMNLDPYTEDAEDAAEEDWDEEEEDDLEAAADDEEYEDGDYDDEEGDYDDEEYDEDEDDELDTTVGGMVAESSFDDEVETDDWDAREDEDDSGRAAAAAAAAVASSRRDLLPDIEEINSTLRASGDRSAGDPGTTDYHSLSERPRRRSGTRVGFALAILIFAGLIAAYANAPRIAEAVPQAAPIINAYAEQVDRLRLWIDDMAQGALSPETDTPAMPAPEAGDDGGVPEDAAAPAEEEAPADAAEAEEPAASE
ncbi:hypothetical protein HKCCE3408_10275 [Rhodobacterales bacterium HKCCE3408]|nr:hypothetical protein [Rhodobacterales bacterium HKCCE3408]